MTPYLDVVVVENHFPRVHRLRFDDRPTSRAETTQSQAEQTGGRQCRRVDGCQSTVGRIVRTPEQAVLNEVSQSAGQFLAHQHGRLLIGKVVVDHKGGVAQCNEVLRVRGVVRIVEVLFAVKVQNGIDCHLESGPQIAPVSSISGGSLQQVLLKLYTRRLFVSSCPVVDGQKTR